MELINGGGYHHDVWKLPDAEKVYGLQPKASPGVSAGELVAEKTEAATEGGSRDEEL